MKQLKRSECAILPLVLKGKWYDMIASGEKKEEYRDRNAYWCNRIHRYAKRIKNKIAIVSFARGYKKASMFFKIDSFSVHGLEPIYEKWGQPKTPHYVIKLGERVELVD